MGNNISLIDIGERIKQLRESEHLTQAQLAKKLNVKSQTINQWEHGERDLKTGYIIELANFFGVSADYILCLENCKTHTVENISNEIGLSENNIINLMEMSETKDVFIRCVYNNNNCEHEKVLLCSKTPISMTDDFLSLMFKNNLFEKMAIVNNQISHSTIINYNSEGISSTDSMSQDLNLWAWFQVREISDTVYNIIKKCVEANYLDEIIKRNTPTTIDLISRNELKKESEKN